MKEFRLLIVDDEEDLRDVLVHQLKPVAGTMEVAENGREALEALMQRPFDAVLSDINMPKMTGLELLREIRGMELDVPFVILTGFGDKAKAVEALRSGAFDFLEKPWSPDVLRRTMLEALEYGRKLHEIEFELGLALEDLKGLSAERAARVREARKELKTMRLNKRLLKKTG